MSGVSERLADVQARIARAADAAGRAPGDVRLIAVTKTFGAAAIEPALLGGHRDFGENRVQEAERKFPALKARFPDLTLHLIGPLQSNKARQAVRLFDAIHSLDREKLAAELAKQIAAEGRRPALFVQVNTGGEAQKAGIDPADAEAFVGRCRDVYRLSIEGLMCIPPLADDPRPHFELLRALGARLGLKKLSMGMSGDFETAIACGATHVRVGSAIFGDRA
jgi:pyridoxal phosphate enzyme (YggS family)